jgi:predicted negative regulator of RcsB-dependent stress response
LLQWKPLVRVALLIAVVVALALLFGWTSFLEW